MTYAIQASVGLNFNSISPDSTRNNERLCFSDESCCAVDGTGRAVPRFMELEGQMRD